METKFKDVAHLYLGCNVQDDNTPSGYTAMLCSCDLSGDANIFYFDKNGNCDVDSNIVSISEVKPILRPLSDLSKYELDEIVEIGEVTYRGESPEIFIIGWKAFGANTFTYLLSRLFDLFGLIESGEAIDKTKL